MMQFLMDMATQVEGNYTGDSGAGVIVQGHQMSL